MILQIKTDSVEVRLDAVHFKSHTVALLILFDFPGSILGDVFMGWGFGSGYSHSRKHHILHLLSQAADVCTTIARSGA